MINTAIAANVPCSNPSPFTKRWWTKELSQAHSTMRHATRLANNVTNDPSHPSHREYQLHRNTYTNLICSTKKRHWTDWLEEVDDTSIWSINHLISGPSTDHRRTRIPPLKSTTNIGDTQQVMEQSTQKQTTICDILPITRSPPASRNPWKVPPPPDLQLLTNIRQANPTDHLQNEPFQGYRTKRPLQCNANSLHRLTHPISRLYIPHHVSA